MKAENWQEHEGIRPITFFYLVMSILFMSGAATFFKLELKTSAGTPAESRNLNADCFIGIFDNHDMWHFVSATALFLSFIFLLTIDDDLLDTPWENVSVF